MQKTKNDGSTIYAPEVRVDELAEESQQRSQVRRISAPKKKGILREYERARSQFIGSGEPDNHFFNFLDEEQRLLIANQRRV